MKVHNFETSPKRLERAIESFSPTVRLYHSLKSNIDFYALRNAYKTYVTTRISQLQGRREELSTRSGLRHDATIEEHLVASVFGANSEWIFFVATELQMAKDFEITVPRFIPYVLRMMAELPPRTTRMTIEVTERTLRNSYLHAALKEEMDLVKLRAVYKIYKRSGEDELRKLKEKGANVSRLGRGASPEIYLIASAFRHKNRERMSMAAQALREAKSDNIAAEAFIPYFIWMIPHWDEVEVW